MRVRTMIKFGKFSLVITLIFAVLLTQGGFISAQEDDSSNNTSTTSNLSDKEKRKRELRNQLNDLKQELGQLQQEAEEYRSEEQSYERQINILESEIRQTRLKIRRNRLVMEDIELAMDINQEEIEELQNKAETQEELLSNLLLSLYKADNTSSLEIVLTSDSLSEFFNNVNRMGSLEEEMKTTLNKVQKTKSDIEEEQKDLEKQREERVQTIQVQRLQRSELANKTQEKERLLSQVESKREQVESQAESTKKTITQVRNQIFRLEDAGVAINFEDAYNHAKFASQLTGVRPAYLLALLQRESSWGQNTGLCFLEDPETGMGRGANSGKLIYRVMKPDRDVQPFLRIAESLGRDPFNTRVSCPADFVGNNGTYYVEDYKEYVENGNSLVGYGGAMGPAQFIPSTWMAWRDRVANTLGYNPDPWRIRDAFAASAVKLAGAGAAKGTYDAEWKAAMIYYAGGNWDNPRYWPYANWVMDKAAEYQKDIDILEGR